MLLLLNLFSLLCLVVVVEIADLEFFSDVVSLYALAVHSTLHKVTILQHSLYHAVIVWVMSVVAMHGVIQKVSLGK